MKRVAAKIEALQEAGPEQREVLAKLINSRDAGAVELAVTILTDKHLSTASLSDLMSIANAGGDMESGVAAAALGRDRLKRVAALLSVTGTPSAKSLPASDTKAALLVANAVTSLSEAALANLTSIEALARRT